MPINLALADDHSALRMCLASCLEMHISFKTIIQATDGAHLIDQFRTAETLPDICLLDLNMPVLDGFETLKIITAEFPDVKVVIYSTFLEEFNLLRAYKEGACAALSKSCELTELFDALKQVHTNGIYIPKGISRDLESAIRKHNIVLPKISYREDEFLRHYCNGLSYKEISHKMGITIRTAECYKDNLTQKLGIQNRIGLLLFALRTGISGWKI